KSRADISPPTAPFCTTGQCLRCAARAANSNHDNNRKRNWNPLLFTHPYAVDHEWPQYAVRFRKRKISPAHQLSEPTDSKNNSKSAKSRTASPPVNRPKRKQETNSGHKTSHSTALTWLSQ